MALVTILNHKYNLLKYPNMISQWAVVHMVTKRTKRLLYVNEKIEEL